MDQSQFSILVDNKDLFYSFQFYYEHSWCKGLRIQLIQHLGLEKKKSSNYRPDIMKNFIWYERSCSPDDDDIPLTSTAAVQSGSSPAGLIY